MVVKSPRILMAHHTAMWYRIPFFRGLDQKYQIKFLFTNVQGYNKTYDTQLSQEIGGMEGLNYQVIPKRLGVAWKAIFQVMGDYDIFVGGSWDTPGDVIETLLYFLLVKIKRKPFILWREDWDWKVTTLKRRLAKIFARFIAGGADAVLVPGVKHRKFFTNLGVSSEKIFIMPNVSNLTLKEEDIQKREELRLELNIDSEKVILFVGRLIELKGVNYLLQAFKELLNKKKDIYLIILGDGECREELEGLAEELQIADQVFFQGNVDNSQLGAYYLLSDLFVLPSITTHHADACPLVVNEAMYFGLPVVTTDAVGTTFMIEEGVNGFVVPEKDVIALSIAMYKILSQPHLAKKMGEASKKIIEDGFTYKNMLQGFNQAVSWVLEK